MTVTLSGKEATKQLAEQFPDALIESDQVNIVVRAGALLQVADFLKTSPKFYFNCLTSITAVDYLDYFEVVYRLTSLKHNHSLVLKVRCYDRGNPTVPSVTSLWRGADFQEREIYDLMGIFFTGHPNLKRILLWEGFSGHPLRRDYL